MDVFGNILWVIIVIVLVLFMMFGVVFFYGGFVKVKSVVSMMMMSFGLIGFVVVLWIFFGFLMSVVDSFIVFVGNLFVDFGLLNLVVGEGLNVVLFGVVYGVIFVIIIVVLIFGVIVDCVKFGSWLIFVGIFVIVGYFFVVVWVWGGGWIMNFGIMLFGEDSGIGVIDYVGGIVVYINVGVVVLVFVLVFGKCIGFQKGIFKLYNVLLMLLGVVLLWFGWFGFNVGVEWFVEDMGGVGFIGLNMFGVMVVVIFGWIFIEWIKDGKVILVGVVFGVVVGLVVIILVCVNFILGWLLLFGVVVGIVCVLVVELKFWFGFDDLFDVVGIYFVGGFIGILYFGFFVMGIGLFVGGDVCQFVVQFIVVLGVLIYFFVVVFIIGFVIQKMIGFCIMNEDEIVGVDQVVYGEEGYVFVDV